jgi:hypothetical protein
MPSTAPPQPPLHLALDWQEIGRPSTGEAQDWATWVALLGGGGGDDVLYRALVVADGDIAVTVELHLRRGLSGPRAVHRGRCRLSPHPDQTAERVRLLLAAADRAAANAVKDRFGEVATAAHDRLSPHRVPDAARNGTRGGNAGTASRGAAERTREHARQDVATAA